MTFVNGTMMQAFHWYIEPDGQHWNTLKDQAKELAEAGINALWLPPAYKGQGGGYDVGYGVYDLFDLGEFDQKGSVRTKYGTKDEYVAAVKALQAAGVSVYADVVFNHKDGGDEPQKIRAVPYSIDDMTTPIGDVQEIEAYTKFTFPGRGEKYSTFNWDATCFDCVNHNMYDPGRSDIVYLWEGQEFESFVSLEKGNFDFLLGCDLDFGNDLVCQELEYWGRWLLDTVGVDGFRIDAVKHIPAWFFPRWLDHVRGHAKKDLFAVGEYWSQDSESLHWYLDVTDAKMSVFDVKLHYNFHYASKVGKTYDIRLIFDGSLMKEQPALAVTFVANHDSQPLQALESVVEPWFKPLGYAIILLRAEGYPCIFYPDYYGAHYKDTGSDGQEHEVWMVSHKFLIDKFLYARTHYAYGPQYDYFDHWDVMGWTRLGDEDHPKAMAVVLSNGDGGHKWMEVGKPDTTFYDITEHIQDTVTTNEHGWGTFPCNGGSVSVWVEKEQ